MTNEARLMEPFEIIGLVDLTVTIREIGLEGIAFEMPDGRLAVIMPCQNCGGPESHLNYGFAEDDADSAST